MATRPAYSKPIVKAYRGMVSQMKQVLDRCIDKFHVSPGFKAEVTQTLKEFAANQGLNLDAALPSTQIKVSSGVKVTAPAITGTYVNGYTFTIVGGVVTAIVAS